MDIIDGFDRGLECDQNEIERVISSNSEIF